MAYLEQGQRCIYGKPYSEPHATRGRSAGTEELFSNQNVCVRGARGQDVCAPERGVILDQRVTPMYFLCIISTKYGVRGFGNNATGFLRRIAIAMLVMAAGAWTAGSDALAQAIEIHSDVSGRCLDADTATIGGNGTKVQLWDCWGGQNQKWQVNTDGTLVNAQSQRCLDADTATILGNGTKMQLWDCWGGRNQKWQVNADGTLVNAQSQRCLDADTATIGGNGTKIQLWQCWGGQNQEWRGPRHIPLKDFDVGTSTFDVNGFPLNPKWGAQIEHNLIPDPKVSCPVESDSDNPDDWTNSPQYPLCTTVPVTFNGGIWCGPHVNFMPVTYEGIVRWDDHSSAFLDDDYTLNVTRDDAALYSAAGSQVHIEFNSDETVDNWDDTHTWWDNFHHNAVDQSKAQASAMIDGKSVIVIGLLNLDTLHGAQGAGKTELHPVYAMFVPYVKSNEIEAFKSSWAFFVRNWGDQGFCGSDDQGLYSREMKVFIPYAESLTSNNVWYGAQNDDQLSAMKVSIQPYGGGMLLTFILLPPEKQSWFVGDLTFRIRPVIAGDARTPAPATGRNQNTTNDDNDEKADPAFQALQARIDRLPESSKKELNTQLRNLIPKKKSFPVKVTLISEPAKVEERHLRSPVKVIPSPHLVRATGNVATAILNRQKRIEFVKKYLAEKGVE